jgi:hypothetical protein
LRFGRVVPYVGVTHVVAAPFALMSEATGRLVGRLGAHYFLHSGPPAQETEGSLFEPVREGTGVRGGWASRGGHGPSAPQPPPWSGSRGSAHSRLPAAAPLDAPKGILLQVLGADPVPRYIGCTLKAVLS